MTPKVFKLIDDDKEDLSKLQELMVITMEECGELIQACSKAIRCNDYNNDTLKEEVGDVMCMIDLMVEYDIISKKDLSNGSQLKKMKLLKWSKLL